MTEQIPEDVRLSTLEEVVGPQRWGDFRRGVEQVRQRLDGVTVWNINSTARGGGVAEMLRPALGYCHALDLSVRWLVLGGDSAFFEVTKRLHYQLHGSPGDGGALGDEERRIYEATLGRSLPDLLELIRPGDVVICHDPQSAGLIPALRAGGAHVIWRCHIGHDEANEITHSAWAFLEPYISQAEALVFTRREFVPDWIDIDRTAIIHPAIDPLSLKNCPLDAQQTRAALERSGMLAAGSANGVALPHPVQRDVTLISENGPPAADEPLIVQVSRWDDLKDPLGVMRAFVDHLGDVEASLALAGPDVASVSDDPTATDVWQQVRAVWQGLTPQQRSRVYLVCVPMDDLDENALIVNALQRHATVIVQKSLHEGFGLTVTEAMWKRRPVVASAVGGIQDQIEDGVSGLLLQDPRSDREFAGLLRRLLADEGLIERLGAAAHDRAAEHFLVINTIRRYAALIDTLVRESG
ncbi:MAG: glycosyltransferase [Phycisphaerales bacterium JB039]